MVLWYIEQVPEYKVLLDEILADAEAHIAGGDRAERSIRMSPRRREAFLFLSAPHSLTPVHFDPEQNFSLQVSGAKDMHVLAFDGAVSANRELERYYDGGHRNLERIPGGAGTLFRLNPGEGVYVPAFAPHWVQNGAQFCISLSVTFRTRASERFERVHQFNAKLRQVHLHPRPPGVSSKSDVAKEAAHLAVSESKRIVVDAGRRFRRITRSQVEA